MNSNRRSLIEKIRYYGNPLIHLQVLRALIIVSAHRRQGYHTVLHPVTAHMEVENEEALSRKLQHYCSVWFSLRAILRFRDACFFRSTVICHVLRSNGVDATLHFGTMKADGFSEEDWHYSGHCWVTTGAERSTSVYPFIFHYPSEGTS